MVERIFRHIQSTRKMKLKNIFFCLEGVYLLDFISTIIGINFVNGLTEMSVLPAYFFSLGLFGWIICVLFTTLILLLFSLFIYKAQNYIISKANDGCSFWVVYISISTFVMLELFTVIHNSVVIYYAV